MSSSSDVYVEIRGCVEEEAILAVMQEHIEVTSHEVHGRNMDVEGHTTVCDPQEFADPLAGAIQKANGRPCSIEIGMRPCHWESFTYDEDDCDVDGADDDDEDEC
jgi:hypothetical protein